jgi:hypothetical protein
MSRKEYFSVSLTRALVKQTALHSAIFPYLYDCILCIVQSLVKNPVVDSVFLQITFAYARNNSGPSTLPELTLSSSDNCYPSLFVYGPKGIPLSIKLPSSLLRRLQFLLNSREWGTESKAFQKSVIIASVLRQLSNEPA